MTTLAYTHDKLPQASKLPQADGKLNSPCVGTVRPHSKRHDSCGTAAGCITLCSVLVCTVIWKENLNKNSQLVDQEKWSYMFHSFVTETVWRPRRPGHHDCKSLHKRSLLTQGRVEWRAINVPFCVTSENIFTDTVPAPWLVNTAVS
jgi:hypothetical protein